ncbi:MAG TPA: Na+/H+ antiporter NhaA [Chitinophagaceae bacterium]|nr:Na+/H+ antiporter NhaA [Chitinophagaceae bacterium]HMZ46341.1 Na+/H+ antiporter NhaA [Chitinophagaceae bacterium]HNE92885.1 Na+/H+ antiporter NhaA [Chitinophagaceae bacterium]HNM34129.1 Na+/H+ antiporter NhaA [Chitinophagaceae bacterium]
MLQFLKNKFVNPLKEIIHDSRSIGIVLLACTILSLVLANISSINLTYTSFWNFSFNQSNEHSIPIGFLNLPNSILIIINDFLMAFFFFLAGMEIKRELTNGELSSYKKSILPIIAAIGGMLFPAIIYFAFNISTNHLHGWAIPTATDIAFTLGIASLLGKRVPLSLKIFITALAIIDDLGAILVIAFFYGSHLHFTYLFISLLLTLLLILINKFKNKFVILHIIVAFLLWYCMFNSGIHATLAGVIVAFIVPAKSLSKLEMKLHTPVYFIVLPIFALANTAIIFPNNIPALLNTSLSWGIIAGLVFGKPLGIFIASFITIKTKLAQLPTKTNYMQLAGAGILCGVGFTMSIFISSLAFNEPINQDTAKIAVLFASSLAIILGIVWFKIFAKPYRKN